jgi:hypothetical protein
MFLSLSLSISFFSRARIYKCFIALPVWQVTAKLLKLSLCDFLPFFMAQTFLNVFFSSTKKACFEFMEL